MKFKTFVYLLTGGIFLINQIEAIANNEINSRGKVEKATIVIGSTNPLKIKAVKNVVEPNGIRVVSYSASSGVSSQPMSEKDTRQGAINRAEDSLNNTNAEIGIGLEAGIVFLDDKVYLTHWGALVDRCGNRYISNAPIILLPSEYKKSLLAGKNLEEIMHRSTGIENLGRKEGAVGIFTDNQLTREQVSTDLVKVLLAQYQHYNGKIQE